MSRQHPIIKDPRKGKIEWIEISTLTAHPRNYADHPQDQIEHIKNSITEHGFYRNVVVSSDSVILAGHGTTEAAKQLGMTKIPVCRLNIESDSPTALKVLIGDNEISHLREVDDRELTELLKQINETESEDLLGTGYDEMMLASLLLVTRDESEIPNMDAAQEWVNAGMGEHAEGIESQQLIIHFTTAGERMDFIKSAGLFVSSRNKKTDKTLSIWYGDNDK